MPNKFRYPKTPKPRPIPVDKPTISQEEEDVYTGIVLGDKASHGEENFYNAIMKTGMVSYVWFRYAVGAPRNLPGQKELDFLIITLSGAYIAVQIRDYEFVHAGAEMQAKDRYSDIYILEELRNNGITVVDNEIKSVDNKDVDTPEEAKKVAERMML
jgi:hypothetical protein